MKKGSFVQFASSLLLISDLGEHPIDVEDFEIMHKYDLLAD
jgi:hypothetical protein